MRAALATEIEPDRNNDNANPERTAAVSGRPRRSKATTSAVGSLWLVTSAITSASAARSTVEGLLLSCLTEKVCMCSCAT